MTPEDKQVLDLLPPGVTAAGRRRAYAGLVAKRIWPQVNHLVGLVRLILMTNENGIGDLIANDILTLAGEEDFQ